MIVAIFGHYVRDLENLGHSYFKFGDLSVPVRYFPFPGFCYNNFVVNPKLLDDLVCWKPDVMVIILGGNGIKEHVDLNVIKANCEKCFYILRLRLPNSYIVVSQIELRHLERVNRHGTPSSVLYKKLAVNFNKWLCRRKFKNKILLVNGETKLSKPSFFKSDDVHLNRRGLNLLFSLIISC